MNPKSVIPSVHQGWSNILGVDIRSLALIRILIATIVLCDLVIRATTIVAHYGDSGILPRIALLTEWQAPWLISLHLTNGTWQFQALLFIIAAFFAVMLLVGWKTRLATIVTWCLIVSLHNSNPLVLQGGDVLLRVILFWAIFLPWGMAFSVDRALSYSEPTKKNIFSVWTAGLLLQISFLYLFASFFKGYGEPWLSGLSVYYALNIDQFTTPVGEVIRDFPTIMLILSFSVFWLQKVAFFLLFSPFFTRVVRTLCVVLLMFMHASFALTMNLGPFSFVSITILFAFLHPDIWDAFLKRFLTEKRLGLKIYYDGDCGFCKKSVFIIKTFFLIPETKILSAQDYSEVRAVMIRHDSWVVEDSTCVRYLGFDAAICIAEHSPILRYFVPLMRLKVSQILGEKMYKFVANHRSRICDTEIPKSVSNVAILDTKLASALGIFLIVYVFLWNLASLPDKRFHKFMPNEFVLIGPLLTINQKWSMFAPIPSMNDGWYILAGKLKNGKEIDLFQEGKELSWLKPENISKMYTNERWRKYHMNISEAKNSRFLPYYASYLCSDWNNAHIEEQKIDHISIIFMLETTLPNYEIHIPEQKMLYEQDCIIQKPAELITPSADSC